jgi:hypothetical protein
MPDRYTPLAWWLILVVLILIWLTGIDVLH